MTGASCLKGEIEFVALREFALPLHVQGAARFKLEFRALPAAPRRCSSRLDAPHCGYCKACDSEDYAVLSLL